MRTISPSLYTYSSLSTVSTGSYRREYRPLQNPLPSRRTSHLLGIRTPFDPSNPLQTSPPPTDCYGPAILLCGPLRTRSTRCEPSPTRYKTPPPAISFLRPFYTPCGSLQDPFHPLRVFPTCYKLLSALYNLCRRPALHNMADIRRQIDNGQKKWRQGPDLTSANDINDYVKFKTLKYAYYKFTNDDLWE